MKRSRFICLMLSILLILSTLFTACNCNCGGEEEQQAQGKQGIHGGTVEETDKYLVKDGKSDYVLVYDKDVTDPFISSAKNVFLNFFREATKIALPEKDDNEVTQSNDLKAIVLGENAVSEAAGLTNEVANKSRMSFQIKTIGNTIYVLGEYYGLVYGAEDLLEYLFGFKYYTEYCYDLDKGVMEEKLCNYDITEVPDIQNVVSYTTGLMRTTMDPYYKLGVRVNDPNQGGWGSTVHNSYYCVPPTEYFRKSKDTINPFTGQPFDPEGGYMAEHREWYSPRVGGGYDAAHAGVPNQLCYSRADEFFDIVYDKMRYLAVNDDSSCFAFSFEDSDTMCECADCMAAEKKYGSQAALLMKFCSDMVKAVNEWLKTDEAKAMMEESGRFKTEIQIITLAYHATYEAPAVFNAETGKYEVTAPELQLDKNLLVQFCTRNADRFSALNAQANASYRDNLIAWGDITDQLAMWIYNQAWYGEAIQWNGYFSCMQENYRFMFENDVSWIMDEGQGGSSYLNHTGFQILRGYLMANLSWDCNQDYGLLIDKYFNRVFGEAAEEMRFIFDSLEANLQSKYLAGKIRGIEHHLMTKANYSKGFLENLLEVGNLALEKIKPLRETNEQEYLRMEKRISTELLSLRYMLIELYFDEIPAEELLEMRLFYRTETTRLQILSGGTTVGGSNNLQDMYNRWGIA